MLPGPGTTICSHLRIDAPVEASLGTPVFGPVVRACNTQTDEALWLTIVERTWVPSSGDLSRFMAGARGLIGIRHAGLLRVALVDQEADFCVVGYNVVSGAQTLGALLDAGRVAGLLPRVAVDLAWGLAALHHRGCSHGVLGLNTVVMVGGSAMAWQCGLLEHCNPDRRSLRCRELVAAGVVPEMLAGEPVDASADVYAWGAVVAEVASGLRGAQAISKALDKAIDEAGHEGLFELVRNALADDPSDRPRDGVELLQDLQAAYEEETGGDERTLDLVQLYLGEFDRPPPHRTASGEIDDSRPPSPPELGRISLVRAPARKATGPAHPPELYPRAGEILSPEDVELEAELAPPPVPPRMRSLRFLDSEDEVHEIAPELIEVFPDTAPLGPKSPPAAAPKLRATTLIPPGQTRPATASTRAKAAKPAEGAKPEPSAPVAVVRRRAAVVAPVGDLRPRTKRVRRPGPHGPSGLVMAMIIALFVLGMALWTTVRVAGEKGELGALLLPTTRACPPDMIAIEPLEDAPPSGGGCIERGEFPGGHEPPRTGVTLSEAQTACVQRGRGLCTASQWQRACEGRSAGGEGAQDLIGGVAEWVEGGAAFGGDATTVGPTCTTAVRPGPQHAASNLGFRCCSPVTP